MSEGNALRPKRLNFSPLKVARSILLLKAIRALGTGLGGAPAAAAAPWLPRQSVLLIDPSAISHIPRQIDNGNKTFTIYLPSNDLRLQIDLKYRDGSSRLPGKLM